MSDLLSDQPADDRTSQFASNNPFRGRAVSPSIPSPTSPFLDPIPASTAARTVPRNPFLDPANPPPSNKAAVAPSAGLLINIEDMTSKPVAKDAAQSSVDDIFTSLKIDDNKMSATVDPNTIGTASSGDPREQPRRPLEGRPRPPHGPASGRGRGRGGPPPHRAKNIPPRQSPSPNHRPTRSQEEALKSRQGSGPAANGESSEAGPQADGPRRPSQTLRPRRNSESSVAPNDKSLSRGDKVLRDLRKREQEQRERGVHRSTSRRNDIIDQLDASSIFGNVFHHDGPFDALNPHRNRKGSRRAPMQAFPKDSLNNVIGGSGPLNSRPDHRTFMGQGEDEAFQDYSGGHQMPPPPGVDKLGSSSRVGVFDPLQRSAVLHGDQTLGLGTSTFLEGTPAARTTIQRREAEKAQDAQDNPLQRKKSLAQRFRSINRGPREPNMARAISTDGAVSAQSGGSRYDAGPNDEFDPKKGDDVITVRRKNSAANPGPASPPRAMMSLERRSTTDGTTSSATRPADITNPTTTIVTSGYGEEPLPKQPSGLLARVKSLKGGRRPAPHPPSGKDS